MKVRGREKIVVQYLFLSNLFYFPYYSAQFRTLSKFLQTEYHSLLLPKLLRLRQYNEEASQPAVTSDQLQSWAKYLAQNRKIQ